VAEEASRLGDRAPGRVLQKGFRANRKAWEFFNAQPPWYRRVCIYWVTSGKKEETRARRLATLIEDSASGRRIGLVTLKPKNG